MKGEMRSGRSGKEEKPIRGFIAHPNPWMILFCVNVVRSVKRTPSFSDSGFRRNANLSGKMAKFIFKTNVNAMRKTHQNGWA